MTLLVRCIDSVLPAGLRVFALGLTYAAMLVVVVSLLGYRSNHENGYLDVPTERGGVIIFGTR
jgi:hypothetical protein